MPSQTSWHFFIFFFLNKFCGHLVSLGTIHKEEIMKKILFLLSALLVPLFLSSTASAQHCRSMPTYTYVSGYTSCGKPIYTKRVTIGYNCQGYPIYRYYAVPYQCGCRKTYNRCNSNRNYSSYNRYNSYNSSRYNSYNRNTTRTYIYRAPQTSSYSSTRVYRSYGNGCSSYRR